MEKEQWIYNTNNLEKETNFNLRYYNFKFNNQLIYIINK